MPTYTRTQAGEANPSFGYKHRSTAISRACGLGGLPINGELALAHSANLNAATEENVARCVAVCYYVLFESIQI